MDINNLINKFRHKWMLLISWWCIHFFRMNKVLVTKPTRNQKLNVKYKTKYFSILFIVQWRVCNIPEVVAKQKWNWNVLAETVQNELDCFRGFVLLSEHGTSDLKQSGTKLQYQNFKDRTGHSWAENKFSLTFR